MYAPICARVKLTLVAGDIASGQVTLRLRNKTSAATDKILAADADSPLQFSAENLG